MIPSIVETLVGACDELSLLLRTLEITRTQNFISVKSVSTPSEAQAAQRVAAHKRAGLLAAGQSLRRSLELNKELLAAEDEKRRDRAQEEREKEDTMPQLSQQAHLHLLYQALKQDERILLTCTDGDFAMLLDGEHTLHFSVAPPTKSEEGGGDPLKAGARLALAKVLRDHFEGGLSDKPELVADAVDLVYHVQLRVELAELIRRLRARGLACLPAWVADPTAVGVPRVDG